MNELLSDKQYGFRKGKSTELALLHLISQLTPAFRENRFAICVFLDYSACFDTIDRNLLLLKLEIYFFFFLSTRESVPLSL